MTESRNILVTGATGKQGGAVARELLARGYSIRAMTRKPEGEAAQALAGLGAEIVRGDLDDAASLARAVEGVWGVFALQNTWEAGVQREEEQGKRLPGAACSIHITGIHRLSLFNINIPQGYHNSSFFNIPEMMIYECTKYPHCR